MMSQISVLKNNGSVDPFLRQASSFLQTYWNTMREVTNKDLLIERKSMPLEQFQLFQVTIEVRIPVVYVQPQELRTPVSFTPVPVTDISGRRRHDSGNTVKSTHEALYLVELVTAYNKNLLRAVTEELKAMRSLKDMQSPLSRTLSKLSKFKEGIVEFSIVIDKMLEYYSALAVGIEIECPTLDDLKIAKDKVCEIKKHLKFEELYHLFARHEFKTTTEDIFCAILGLTSQVSSWLFELHLGIKAHRKPLQLLENYFQCIEDQLREAGLLNDYSRESLVSALLKFGFTEERAETISKSIPVDSTTLQSPCFWAVRFVAQSLNYHPLLDSLPGYLHEPEITNEWFVVDIPLDQRIEQDEDMNETSTWSVQMMNVASSRGDQLVQDFIQVTMEDNYKLLFHGTSSVNAESIVKCGITLTSGSRAQDFSSGDGFYLYEDFEKAKKWAKAGRGGHHAVIVFKVEKNMLDAELEGGLDFHTVNDVNINNNAYNLWRKTVSLCRSQYRNKRLKKELLNGISFVSGPSCSNPASFDDATCLNYEDENDQLCIRDEDYAERFGSLKNIACVLFY